jgi:hypothetical protein
MGGEELRLRSLRWLRSYSARGVVANVEVHDDESTSLWYRNADADVVSTVLAEHGVPAVDQGL